MSSAYRVEDREGEHLHDLPATLSDPQVSETVWPTTQEVPHSVYGGTITTGLLHKTCLLVSCAFRQLSGLRMSYPSQKRCHCSLGCEIGHKVSFEAYDKYSIFLCRSIIDG